MNLTKKLLLAVLIMAMFPFNLFADSYEKLWEKVEEAESKQIDKTTPGYQ